MNYELKKTLSIKIKRIDMFPNHFFGTAEINGESYKINIQGKSYRKLVDRGDGDLDHSALIRLIDGS